ncbi:hypothetical protein [Sphingosinicella terrae]|uniref:hypothetical protein n=1 Tax=Sphingosinicella terrae TaxID=2172047 RepID=UPI0025486EDD|nr:hypothetical protein [Sphingosinicella terrae]
MILAGAAAMLLLAFAGGQDRPSDSRASGTVTVRHQQIIIRMPRGPRRVTPAGTSLIQWRESRGPRCVSAGRLAGATSMRPNSVDLILRDNSRIRAQLQRRCPALDYYRGFYINATEDGRICADRDSIRSRAGGECQIERFHTLSPERRQLTPASVRR